jgi:hypothetical protein
MHSPRRTIEAIERLDDMLEILRDLSLFPGARKDVTAIRYEVQLLLDAFECRNWQIAERRHVRRIKLLESWLYRLDAVYRPLG